MSFYNKKEEVIDVQLTQFGKYMLAKGKFMPVYYAFSDDEILYNNEYTGDTKIEKAKETSTRIQKDTQRLKTLYAYEGAETRVLKLNKHEIRDFGSGWRVRREARFEEMPIGELYGIDYVNEESMEADNRNIIRNMLGHSSLGTQKVPTWEVENLSHGEIVDVNISSSTPNIGIKRPVIEIEVFEELRSYLDPPTDNTQRITKEQYRSQTGLEKRTYFTDNVVMESQESALVLSIIEDNVQYTKENFELEFYIEESDPVRLNPNDLPAKYAYPKRRLYFAESSFNSELIDERYVNYYFDFLTDQSMADLYGVDIFGTQRKKLKDLVKSAVIEQNNFNIDPRTGLVRDRVDPEGSDFGVLLPDVPNPCDDEGDF